MSSVGYQRGVVQYTVQFIISLGVLRSVCRREQKIDRMLVGQLHFYTH
jgi:hypothetical protein